MRVDIDDTMIFAYRKDRSETIHGYLALKERIDVSDVSTFDNLRLAIVSNDVKRRLKQARSIVHIIRQQEWITLIYGETRDSLIQLNCIKVICRHVRFAKCAPKCFGGRSTEGETHFNCSSDGGRFPIFGEWLVFPLAHCVACGAG